MKHLCAFAALLAISGLLQAQVKTYKYPAIIPSHKSETRFGLQFTDPYTALNDITSDSTKSWVAAQNKILDQYRRSVFSKYTVCENLIGLGMMDFNRKALPVRKQKMYFTVGQGSDNVPAVYYKLELDHEFHQLCSTGPFLHDKSDKIFIRDLKPSHDYKYLAIVMSHNGSDWLELRIWDIDGDKYLPEKFEWMKFGSVVWDKNGFFYNRFDTPEKGREHLSSDKNQRIFYHKLGTPVESDKIIYTADDKEQGQVEFYGMDSDKIIITQYSRREKNRIVNVVAYFKPDSLENGIKEFIIVPYDGTQQFGVVGMLGGKFLVQSTYKAPNGQVLLYEPDKINTGKILIEQFKQPIRNVTVLKNRIFGVYYDMGKFVPIVFDSAGTILKKLDIPDGFAVGGFNYAFNDSVTAYSMASFYGLPHALKFDFKNLKTIIYDESVGNIFQSGYTSKIVTYKSKDSVSVPMYLVYKKSVKPDANTPLLIYAYGGFGVPTDPSFNPGFSLFLNQGGILAVPLIRGGGELGEAWHKAGMLLNKHNSFDDFIAATEYLIANNYSSPAKIAIHGGSNGGLLVGAVMVQRPDLFKVVVPAAAVLDLVNFQKFTSAAAVGIREYGNPDDSTDFHNLYPLSPVHHIQKDVKYPATMLIASAFDDRVVPSHSYRFLAALQNDTKDKTLPYLLYQEGNQGHTMEGTLDDFQQMALMYTFIFENLGINVAKMGND